ncbi:MAG: cytochrome b562 [Planctomycetota bacterium]|nr:cytochrome b562 [Planctomycetota bacterium]
MKLSPKSLFVGLALAALVSAPLAYSAMQGPPPRPEGKGEEHHEEGGLEGAMQALNGASKRMNKALEKPDLALVAKTAVDMQKAVLAAKTEMPQKAGEISDAKEKAAFVLAFRKQMIAMQRSLLDLETLALDGKADEAKKLYGEAIAPLKKEGHAKFKD